jgi:hypothetical protein
MTTARYDAVVMGTTTRFREPTRKSGERRVSARRVARGEATPLDRPIGPIGLTAATLDEPLDANDHSLGTESTPQSSGLAGRFRIAGDPGGGYTARPSGPRKLPRLLIILYSSTHRLQIRLWVLTR